MSEAQAQLPLPFEHRPAYANEVFVAAASNRDALAWLDRASEWPNGRLALWGEAGCGKTHLLSLWAERVGATVLSGEAPEVPAAGPVAIDDAERALAAEERLLHQLNAAAEHRRPVLLAARTPPARWNAALPDLRSRLRATTAARIDPSEDALLRLLLRRLLAERQVAVPAAIQDWLLRRLPRSPAAVREAAGRLDRAALAAGRAVTRAVAQGVLDGMAETE